MFSLPIALDKPCLLIFFNNRLLLKMFLSQTKWSKILFIFVIFVLKILSLLSLIPLVSVWKILTHVLCCNVLTTTISISFLFFLQTPGLTLLLLLLLSPSTCGINALLFLVSYFETIFFFKMTYLIFYGVFLYVLNMMFSL